MEFVKWLTLTEMAARRSLRRSMGKYEPEMVGKPVATLTAWRGKLLDPSGHPFPEAERRRRNEAANVRLAANIQRRGLSHYPVVGAGQEVVGGIQTVNKESSFIVQAHGTMPESVFLDHIRELLFNPTGEPGRGPFRHMQYGAIVKLPGDPQAYLLHHPDGITPIEEIVRGFEDLARAEVIVLMKDVLNEEDYRIFKSALERRPGPKGFGGPKQADLQRRIEQLQQELDELRRKLPK